MAHADPFLDELVRVSADIDRLIADRQQSQPSHSGSDRHIDQARALAARLDRAGRGPGRPVHTPIGRTAHGYAW